MFSSEIKETIYVAISLILAAAVLGLVAFVLDIRSDFASARNLETATKQSMETYTAFNKYQGEILYGEDVIAIIREYAGTDIAIYIDELVYENGSKSDFYMSKESVKEDIDGFYKNAVTIQGLEYGTGMDLKYAGGVKRNTTYYSYLVYGEYGQQEIEKADYKDLNDNLYYSDITAIVIKKICDGRKDITDSTVKEYVKDKEGR